MGRAVAVSNPLSMGSRGRDAQSSSPGLDFFPNSADVNDPLRNEDSYGDVGSLALCLGETGLALSIPSPSLLCSLSPPEEPNSSSQGQTGLPPSSLKSGEEAGMAYNLITSPWY